MYLKPKRCEKDNALSLQSGTCQAGVNSCQVGLRSAPLPRMPCHRARAAEGDPRTYLRQQITSAETHQDVRPEHSQPPMRGRKAQSIELNFECNDH